MNRYLLSSISYLLLALTASAGHIEIRVRDLTSGSVTNRRVLLKLQNPGAAVVGPWVIAGDYVIQYTGTNGNTIFSNVPPASYSYTVYGSPERSGVFTMPDTNGLVNVVDLTGTNSTPTYYTSSQIDALLMALGGIGALTNNEARTITFRNGLIVTNSITIGGGGSVATVSTGLPDAGNVLAGATGVGESNSVVAARNVIAGINVVAGTGNFMGAAGGISNAPPSIATNAATAPDGMVLSKTGDKLKLIAAGSGVSAVEVAAINATNGINCNNVIFFGAKGDTTTDDTAAIQAAIFASETNLLPVYLPPAPGGYYKIVCPGGQTSALVCSNKNGFQMFGASGNFHVNEGTTEDTRTGSRLRLVTTGKTLLTFWPKGPSQNANSVRLQNLYFEGPGDPTNTASIGIAVRVGAPDMDVSKFQQVGITGFGINFYNDATPSSIFENCSFGGLASGIGVYIIGTANVMKFQGCNFNTSTNSTSFFIDTTVYLDIDTSEMASPVNGSRATFLYNPGTNGTCNLKMQNCNIEWNASNYPAIYGNYINMMFVGGKIWNRRSADALSPYLVQVTNCSGFINIGCNFIGQYQGTGNAIYLDQGSALSLPAYFSLGEMKVTATTGGPANAQDYMLTQIPIEHTTQTGTSLGTNVNSLIPGKYRFDAIGFATGRDDRLWVSAYLNSSTPVWGNLLQYNSDVARNQIPASAVSGTFLSASIAGAVTVATNALSTWPTAPTTRGGFAMVNSNGYPYMLLSTNGNIGSTTWTATNKLGW